jgi:hypothetical protein
MLKSLVLVYLWLTIFIMIRYWYLHRLTEKQATLRVVSPLQVPKIIIWTCIATFFCIWPILLLIYPSDFVGAFIFNKKTNFNVLLIRVGRMVGLTVGRVHQLFK